MKLKRLLFLFILIIAPLLCRAQDGCFLVNGYWSKWQNLYGAEFQGAINDFVLYPEYQHPSEFFVRVRINNFYLPSKQQIKEHKKTNTWFEYSGTVEYYVSNQYPTIESIFKDYVPWGTWKNMYPKLLQMEKEQYVKRTANATIKLAPTKEPIILNIYFDSVGFGISFNGGSLY